MQIPEMPFQTKIRGSLEDEYQIYCEAVNDGSGKDITTGQPLPTFEEWLNR